MVAWVNYVFSLAEISNLGAVVFEKNIEI